MSHCYPPFKPSHSAWWQSVTKVTSDHNYSINSLESISHSSDNSMQLISLFSYVVAYPRPKTSLFILTTTKNVKKIDNAVASHLRTNWTTRTLCSEVFIQRDSVLCCKVAAAFIHMPWMESSLLAVKNIKKTTHNCTKQFHHSCFFSGVKFTS